MSHEKERVDWDRVETIQRRSFHGNPPTPEEHVLLRAAVEEDPERYAENRSRIVEEYKESLRGGR